MIVVPSPKEYWKNLGIVRHSSSRSGHDIKGDTSNTSIHALNTRDTVEREIPNLYARSRFGKFSLSLIKTITNSWKRESVFVLLVT